MVYALVFVRFSPAACNWRNRLEGGYWEPQMFSLNYLEYRLRYLEYDIYIDEYIVLIDTFTTQKHVQQLLLNLRLDASIDSLDQVRLKSVLWIHVDKMARPICIWIN